LVWVTAARTRLSLGRSRASTAACPRMRSAASHAVYEFDANAYLKAGVLELPLRGAPLMARTRKVRSVKYERPSSGNDTDEASLAPPRRSPHQPFRGCSAQAVEVPVARRVGPLQRVTTTSRALGVAGTINKTLAIKLKIRMESAMSFPQCTSRRAPSGGSPRRRVHWGSLRRPLASAPLRQGRIYRRVRAGRRLGAARRATEAEAR
jgi:hypothetical protein